MSLKKEYKHLNYIMTEMCNIVGADWSKIDPKKKDWFKKYSWTEKQMEEFKNWIVNYLYTNTEARKEILTSGGRRVPKYKIKKAITWFILDYGWSLKK